MFFYPPFYNRSAFLSNFPLTLFPTAIASAESYVIIEYIRFYIKLRTGRNDL